MRNFDDFNSTAAMLMRVPEPCASWEWELDEFAAPGLESAVMAAVQMSEVLREGELLYPDCLEWDWFIFGRGGIGVSSRLSLTSGGFEGEDFLQRILACRPVGYPGAEVNELLVTGAGIWIDGEGRKHRENRLVDLTVSPDSAGLSAEVSIFHDIWGRFDFQGNLHTEIHIYNAPRLTYALTSLNALLGVEAQPGEPTYFGRAEGYGVKAPDVLEGRGPDLTDRL